MIPVFIGKCFCRTRSCGLIATRGNIYVQRKQICRTQFKTPTGPNKFLVLVERLMFLNQGQKPLPEFYVRILLIIIKKDYNLTVYTKSRLYPLGKENIGRLVNVHLSKASALKPSYSLLHTTVAQASFVKTCRVWEEMFWSCLLGAVIQFARIFPYDVVIALTDGFSFTADIALVKGSYGEPFKDESLQSHAIYTPFPSALFISVCAVYKDASEEEERRNSPLHFLGLSIYNCRRD